MYVCVPESVPRKFAIQHYALLLTAMVHGKDQESSWIRGRNIRFPAGVTPDDIPAALFKYDPEKVVLDGLHGNVKEKGKKRKARSPKRGDGRIEIKPDYVSWFSAHIGRSRAITIGHLERMFNVDIALYLFFFITKYIYLCYSA